MNHLIHTVSKDRWAEAQNGEYVYWRDQGVDGDDWNDWWRQQFDGYSAISIPLATSILEVGCGPFARNLRWFLDAKAKLGGRFTRVAVEDPLLFRYAAEGKFVGKIIDAGARASNEPLEAMDLGETYDIVLCINVLDHVMDAQRCIANAIRHTSIGGHVVIGQDLTEAEDLVMCPESYLDEKHPIKLSLDFMNTQLSGLANQWKKVLPRGEGRNPKAHAATLLFVGTKI